MAGPGAELLSPGGQEGGRGPAGLAGKEPAGRPSGRQEDAAACWDVTASPPEEDLSFPPRRPVSDARAPRPPRPALASTFLPSAVPARHRRKATRAGGGLAALRPRLPGSPRPRPESVGVAASRGACLRERKRQAGSSGSSARQVPALTAGVRAEVSGAAGGGLARAWAAGERGASAFVCVCPQGRPRPDSEHKPSSCVRPGKGREWPWQGAYCQKHVRSSFRKPRSACRQ